MAGVAPFTRADQMMPNNSADPMPGNSDKWEACCCAYLVLGGVRRCASCTSDTEHSGWPFISAIWEGAKLGTPETLVDCFSFTALPNSRLNVPHPHSIFKSTSCCHAVKTLFVCRIVPYRTFLGCYVSNVRPPILISAPSWLVTYFTVHCMARFFRDSPLIRAYNLRSWLPSTRCHSFSWMLGQMHAVNYLPALARCNHIHVHI